MFWTLMLCRRSRRKSWEAILFTSLSSVWVIPQCVTSMNWDHVYRFWPTKALLTQPIIPFTLQKSLETPLILLVSFPVRIFFYFPFWSVISISLIFYLSYLVYQFMAWNYGIVVTSPLLLLYLVEFHFLLNVKNGGIEIFTCSFETLLCGRRNVYVR